MILKNSGIDDSILEMFQSPDFPTKHSVPLYDGFKLPIEYLKRDQIHQLSDNVIADLELDASAQYCGEMYSHFASPQSVFARQMVAEFKHKYTSNVDYLKDTQQTVLNMAHFSPPSVENASQPKRDEQAECDAFLEIWQDMKEDAAFLEKYSYMEWNIVEHLNNSSAFLQTWSAINFLSPLTSMLVPIILLVFPFVLIRMKGVPITFEQYLDTLKDIAKNHFIGKMLNVKSLSFESIMYVVFTAGLYALQMYQNTVACMRFYSNIQRINQHLLGMREYVDKSITEMSAFLKHNEHLPTYAGFCAQSAHHLETLQRIRDLLTRITPFSVNLSTFLNIGYMMKIYYRIHCDADFEDALRYSVGFGGYVANLRGIYQNVKGGHVHLATFTQKKYSRIRQQYYPAHRHLSPVKNDCKLKTNMIISGVNASGKTTYLKTTALNIIFTQQFGMGFYRKCVLRPYTHIHSYLNIPDTSGRDSLFQAESRRCKEIIDAVQKTQHTHSRHFCIFDELYSGTNPEEATKSAYSLLNYLSNYENVQFILTTHYFALCKKYKGNKRVKNFKMDVSKKDGKLVYTYHIKRGISNLHGGVEILKNMNYPEEIISNIENTNI